MSVSVCDVRRAVLPDVPGWRRLPRTGGRFSLSRRVGSCWSAVCGERLEAASAGDEGAAPSAARADLEDLLAGVPGEAGGDAPDESSYP